MKKTIADIPDLMSEWHPTKNGRLEPREVSYGSQKRVWWQCSVHQSHEWSTTAWQRAGNHTGCPYCRGKKVSVTNSLRSRNPQLAKEWHPTKNGELNPEDVTWGSRKKVWWCCLKNPKHEWQAAVHSRNSGGTNCPSCSGASTSEPEIRILCELKYLLGENEVLWRHKIGVVEADIYVPKLNIAIEYDGNYWHREKFDADVKKNYSLGKKGIQTIRVREHPLQLTSPNDVLVTRKYLTKSDLNRLVSKIRSLSEHQLGNGLRNYKNESAFLNDKQFRRFISFLPSPPPEYSFKKEHPEIAVQWDHVKNNPLLPENFSSGSNKKVWWKCQNGEDHEWKTAIHQRTTGTGCPFCSNRRVSKTNNLKLNNPQFADEWHPTKNGELTPELVTYISGKSIWWKCPKGDDHEWISSVGDRYKGSCPYCTGKKASKKYNLKVINPEVASEWHPTKNDDLKPEDVSPNSSKIVWWKCPKGQDHQWIKRVAARHRKIGCPFCSGRRASEKYNLLVDNPKLAEEWHPTKNGVLGPENVTKGSIQKVWWACSKNRDHDWKAQVNNRNNGTGCPYCRYPKKAVLLRQIDLFKTQ